MLKVRDLSAGYGKLRILDEISLDAGPGKLTVIVGPNGSGKSTLLKSIAGLTSIYNGFIELDGKIVSNRSADDVARMGIAYLPQTDNVFANLMVQENLKLAGYTVSSKDYSRLVEETLVIFPKLRQYLKTKAKNLSGGERQMLAMSMALLRKPVVMMFDEPTGNLAPNIASQVLDTISSLGHDMKLTILLVEQNARAALKIGDSAHLLVSGRSAFEGNCADLLEHKELARLYLGLRTA